MSYLTHDHFKDIAPLTRWELAKVNERIDKRLLELGVIKCKEHKPVGDLSGAKCERCGVKLKVKLTPDRGEEWIKRLPSPPAVAVDPQLVVFKKKLAELSPVLKQF